MNTVINIRTQKKLRDEAKKVFEGMGLSTSAGVNMFLQQVVREKGIPFQPTLNARKIRERWDKQAEDAIRSGKSYGSGKEVLQDL